MANHTLDDKMGGQRIYGKGRRGLAYQIAAWVAAGALLLSSCSKPTPAVDPPSTATDKPAMTQTSTPAPSPVPTLAPLTLGDFSAQLEGVGTNGTMACITYGGDAADLDKITLRADISQGGKKLEMLIPAQQMDGRTCFEVVDAKYVSVNPDNGMLIIPEDVISLQINATSTEGRVLSNNSQTLDLGKYIQFPFLEWIYDTKQVCRDNYHKGYVAWDFIPYPTEENPIIVGTPVYAPVDGIIYVFESALTETGKNYITMLNSPSTGYLVGLQHDAHIYINSDGKFSLITNQAGSSVSASNVVAMIGMKDDASDLPHIHMEIIPLENQTLSGTPEKIGQMLYQMFYANEIPSLDFIGLNLFLDSSVNTYLKSLPNTNSACKSLAWGTLPEAPQQLPFVIDGSASDWEGYTPVMTDPSGDSSAGDVMDLTALYMAMDDNYLYFMLKAGSKPAQDWGIVFKLDTGPENVCGAFDRVFSIDTLNPNRFCYANDLQNCDNYGCSPYPGIFEFGDVLEIRVPLMFIDRLDIKITQIEVYIKVSDNNFSQPDNMP